MLRAETQKLTTTISTRVSILAAVLGLILTQLAFTVLLPLLSEDKVVGADIAAEVPSIDMSIAANQLAALSPFGTSTGAGSIGVVIVAVVLLGVLAGTSDFRYGGVTGAALAEPRRTRIVLAKTGAVAAHGALTGLALAAAAVLTLLLTLNIRGIEFTASLPLAASILGRGILAITLLTLVGLAVGLLLRNQLAAVLVLLGTLVFEPVLMSIVQLTTGTLPAWAQILPVSLSQAVVSPNGVFSPGGALIALITMAALLLAAATIALHRRDL